MKQPSWHCNSYYSDCPEVQHGVKSLVRRMGSERGCQRSAHLAARKEPPLLNQGVTPLAVAHHSFPNSFGATRGPNHIAAAATAITTMDLGLVAANVPNSMT